MVSLKVYRHWSVDCLLNTSAQSVLIQVAKRTAKLIYRTPKLICSACDQHNREMMCPNCYSVSISVLDTPIWIVFLAYV